MTPERRLVYDFLGLPHHIQIGIGREMGFAENLPDESHMQMFCRWFATARVTGKLNTFKQLVSKAISEQP